jgi:hypothetical protein
MIYKDRMTARMDGDFVVFLIGMRINRPLAIHKYLPVLNAMPDPLWLFRPPAELVSDGLIRSGFSDHPQS